MNLRFPVANSDLRVAQGIATSVLLGIAAWIAIIALIDVVAITWF